MDDTVNNQQETPLNSNAAEQVEQQRTDAVGQTELKGNSMAMGAQAYNAYKNAEVRTLSQRELIVKLYEGADKFLLQAEAGIYNSEWEMAHTNCTKAKAIFMELLSTLNFEKGEEIAGQLRDLYLFLIAEIIEGNMTKDAARLKKLHPIIKTLLDAWRDIPEEFANNGGSPIADTGHTFNIRT